MKMKTLPDAFVDLTPFTIDWGLGSQQERHLALMSRSLDELRPFYRALMERMDDIVAYLNQFPLDAMPPEARNLFDLALTWAETAHPLDLRWKTTDIDDSFPAGRIEYLPPSQAPQAT
jgi:hypothetical protein